MEGGREAVGGLGGAEVLLRGGGQAQQVHTQPQPGAAGLQCGHQ